MRMSLNELLNEGRLRQHRTSAREVADLFRIVDRDIADAAIKELSADRRFATAYNAALQLATIVLCASGYRTTRSGHHWATLKALPDLMGSDALERAEFFNSCRLTRHAADYDRAGLVSEVSADEILEEVKAFREEVVNWLQANHPHLLKRKK